MTTKGRRWAVLAHGEKHNWCNERIHQTPWARGAHPTRLFSHFRYSKQLIRIHRRDVGRFNILRLRAFVASAQQHDDDRAMAIDAVAHGAVDAVAFGVPFIANPDLLDRLKRDAPLNAANPKTFYSAGPEGYTDYPTLM